MGDSSVNILQTVRLNDGNSVPVLAYGTGSALMKTTNTDKLDLSIVEHIKQAIAVGYRHIDAAEIYGTELEVGAAIKESNVPREQLFVSSKVFEPNGDIQASFKTSLERLQLDYVDLYMIHQPFTTKTDEGLQKAWAEMEKIKASGKARSIGVSNFNEAQIAAILKTCTVVPAVNQTEYHPYLQRGGLKTFLESCGIALAAYSVQTPIVSDAKPGPLDSVLQEIASDLKVTENAALLRWATQQNVVTVVTTSKEKHMREALQSCNFDLSTESINKITHIGSQKQYRRWWEQFFAADDFS